MSGDRASTLLIKNIKLLATFADGAADIAGAAILVCGPEIQWVGRMADLPPKYEQADEELDLSECVVIPGNLRTYRITASPLPWRLRSLTWNPKIICQSLIAKRTMRGSLSC